ncbi:MAG: AMP-binding protein [Spirochaetes bacterium]|nr:AMP-binding protein [Spirochaetota bacterium]MBU0956146.1 AMP-binding protein [Spirochaetota bacterium]
MVQLERNTLPVLLAAASKTFGTKTALCRVQDGSIHEHYDYAGLAAAAGRFAVLLGDMGIQAGDRVLLLAENRPEWAVAYFGIVLAGAVVVPVLVDFLPEQIANVAVHAEIKAICATEKTMSKLLQLDESLPLLQIDAMDNSGIDARINAGAVHKEFRQSASKLPGYALAASDLAAILYTSGTSGNSKGVMLTHENLVSNAIATRAVFPLYPKDRVLSVMPLAHTLESTMGLITPLLQGCSMYYLDKPPTAPVLASALLVVKPTVMVIVPLIIEKLYRAKVEPKLRNHPLYKFAPTKKLAIKAAGRKLQTAFGGSLRFLGVGGASLARDVEQFLLTAGFPYAIGYGLTETSPLVAAAIPGKTRLGSTGRALDGVEVRIMPPSADEAAASLGTMAADIEGEIQVRGPNVMTGYYRDPERTAEVFTADGWFRTGDLGAFDTKGMLHVKGRLKAMILGPSGENIYPEEIESTLASSGLVEEALVYAAKDGALVALVVLNERAKVLLSGAKDAVAGAMRDASNAARDATHAARAETERLLTNLRASTNARLAAFSRIAKVVLHDQPFEKTATLKIKRYLYPRSDQLT